MAFFLTPRFAPAYQPQACNPFSFYSAPRPTYRRVVARPAVPSFIPFLSQVDELLTELDREARRAQHIQRQQRKRAFRARFEVQENKEGYEVQGHISGFEQQHINIEVTDENTVKVTGNTERQSEQAQAQAQAEQAPSSEAIKDVDMDGLTLAEPEAESTATATTETEAEFVTDAEIIHSDTSSQKSYQATVEDDFEDLGAEVSSTTSSTTEAEPEQPKEPKGKEKAVEESPVQPNNQLDAPANATTEPEEEQYHYTFERSFRFPERIDAANIRASLNNGILSIQVPRAPKHEIRQITIQ